MNKHTNYILVVNLLLAADHSACGSTAWWPTGDHSGSESVSQLQTFFFFLAGFFWICELQSIPILKLVANCRTFWFWICCKPQTILVLNLLPREVEEGGGTKAGRRRLFNCRQPSVCPSSSGSARFASSAAYFYQVPPALVAVSRSLFSFSGSATTSSFSFSAPPLQNPFSFSYAPTHPPTTSIPPYPTSQYISFYLSIYLSIPFCCPELVLNPPADNSPFSKNQNPPSNQQALMNCFCFQNHIAYIIIVWHRLSDFFFSPSSSLRHFLWHASSSAALDAKHLSRSLTPHCCSKILLAGKKEASELAFFICVGHTHTYTDHHLSVLLLLQL